MTLFTSSFCRPRPYLLLAGLLLTGPLGAAEWSGYTSSADAARAVKGAEAKIGYADEAIQRLQGYLVKRRHEAALAAIDRGDFAKIDKEVADTNKKLAALKAERRTAIAEMIQGLFCSGCNRTRSDILSKGEQFPHPGQKIIKATQAQINAKVAEFDRREAALKNQLKSLANRRKSATVRWRQRLIDTQAAVTRTSDSLTNARNARNTAVMDAAMANAAVAMLEIQERQEEAERAQQQLADLQRRQQAEMAARIKREIAGNAAALEQKHLAAEENAREEEEERKKALARAAEVTAQSSSEQKEKIRKVTAQEVQRMRDALKRWGINPDAPSAPTPVEVEKAYSFREELSNKLQEVAQSIGPSAPLPGPPNAAPALREISETDTTEKPAWQKTAKQYYQTAVDYVKDQRGVVKEQVIELAKKMKGGGGSEEPGYKSLTDSFSTTLRQGIDDLTESKAGESTKAPSFFKAVKLELFDKLKDRAVDEASDMAHDELQRRAYHGPQSFNDPKLNDAERQAWQEFDDLNFREKTGYRSIPGLKSLLKKGWNNTLNFFQLQVDQINNDDISAGDPNNP